MGMTDKEIALEITKSYLNHLSDRARSNNINESHATAQNVCNMYKAFYDVVSSVGKSSSGKE